MNRSDLLIALGVGIVMMANYAVFVASLLTGGFLAPASFYEWAVLGVQVVLGAVLFVRKDLRNLDALSTVIVAGSSALTLPAWLALGLLTGSQFFMHLAATTLLSWIAGLAIALPPYAIFRVVRYLQVGSRFSVALPLTVVMAGFLLVLSSLVSPSAGVKDAAGFGQAVLAALAGKNAAPGPSGLSEVALLVTAFVGVILKVVNSAPRTVPLAANLLLGMLAMATLSVLGYDMWLGGSDLAGLLVAGPAFLIVGCTWWLTRGH